MLDRGATTLWEHWEYSDNTFSHNHPMFGSVSAWMYQWVAGIAPAPDAVGFDRVVLRPQPVGDLTFARAQYRSVRGTIRSSWEIADDLIVIRVLLPPGVRGEVILPRGSESKRLQIMDRSGFRRLGDGRIAIESGEYEFSIPWGDD